MGERSKIFFCNTAQTTIRLMKLCNNLNEVTEDSLIKSKIGCQGNKLDKNHAKIQYFSKILEFDIFLEINSIEV